MLYKMFTVRDNTDKACASPFLARTKETAIKMFNKAMVDRKAEEGDFTLLAIGEFDDETGNVRPYQKIEELTNGNI